MHELLAGKKNSQTGVFQQPAGLLCRLEAMNFSELMGKRGKKQVQSQGSGKA